MISTNGNPASIPPVSYTHLKYAGMTREECRRAVVEELKKKGFLEKIETHAHAVGHCQRCGTAVEPMVSRQWFVNMKPLAEPAIRAVKDGSVRFVPERDVYKRQVLSPLLVS